APHAMILPYDANQIPRWTEFLESTQSHLRVRALTRLVPPHSALDLPASHHPKIHSADQLGPACLSGFESYFASKTRVRPKNDHPSDYSCNRPNQDRRIEPARSDDDCQDQGSSGSNCGF